MGKADSVVQVPLGCGSDLQTHSIAIDELRDNDTQFLNVTRLLIAENNLLKEQLAHEREKRADEMEKLELRLRLQISEALRKLPPDNNS